MVKRQNWVIWIQTDSLLMSKQNIYKDTAEDVETRFGTSNYEIDRCLWGKKKKSGWINER